MEINVEFLGADKVLARVDAIVDKIEELGKLKLAAEMTTWQTEDMHRKYPNVTQEDDKTVTTEIWPRSRLALAHTYRNPKAKTQRVYAPPRSGLQFYSTRPILRSELFSKLCDRMTVLLSNTVSW